MYDRNVNTPLGWSSVAFVLHSCVTNLLWDIMTLFHWNILTILSWNIVTLWLLCVLVITSKDDIDEDNDVEDMNEDSIHDDDDDDDVIDEDNEDEECYLPEQAFSLTVLHCCL